MKIRCIFGIHKYRYFLKDFIVTIRGKIDTIKLIRRKCDYCEISRKNNAQKRYLERL